MPNHAVNKHTKYTACAESAYLAERLLGRRSLFVPERISIMYQCHGGHHWWLSAESAERCCNPEWRRVLVIAQPGQALPAAVQGVSLAAGVLCGRQWVRASELESEVQP